MAADLRQELAALSHEELLERCLRAEGGTAQRGTKRSHQQSNETTAAAAAAAPAVEEAVESGGAGAVEGAGVGEEPPAKRRKKDGKDKAPREFDFSRYSTRHIALRLMYLGSAYHGFVVQGDTDQTVEGHLFAALEKLKLIKDRNSCNYTRAGRTDKGVSAYGQVIALHMRSQAVEGPGLINVPTGDAREKLLEQAANQPKAGRRGRNFEDTTEDGEINYVYKLNRVLPDDIRILAWAPVPLSFDARFSALHRTYRYFFMGANLDIPLMQRECKRYLGDHDFRNFCKMDAINVSNFRRVVLAAEIVPVPELSSPDPRYQLYQFQVSGYAFLWHQVRYMVAVLFLIGEHKEQPEIIDRLMDIELTPRRPQFPLASETPLVLYDVGYEGLEFRWAPGNHPYLVEHFRKVFESRMIGAALYNTMLMNLCESVFIKVPTTPAGDDYAKWRDVESQYRLEEAAWVPLVDRPTVSSYEEKVGGLSDKNQEKRARKSRPEMEGRERDESG